MEDIQTQYIPNKARSAVTMSPIAPASEEQNIQRDNPVEVKESVNISDADLLKELSSLKRGYGEISSNEKDSDGVDKYRLGGKNTYYYWNISGFALTFSEFNDSHKLPLRPGDVIDFSDYFSDEEDIIKLQSLRRYTNSVSGKPKLKRLTPHQYADKLRELQRITRKKNELAASNTDNVEKEGRIQPSIQENVGKLREYFSLDEDKRKSYAYTPLDFERWLLGASFSDNEYNWMRYNITDKKMLERLLTRKQELERLALEMAQE